MAADETVARKPGGHRNGAPVLPMQADAVKVRLYTGLGSTDTLTGHFDPGTTLVAGGTSGRHSHVKGVTGTLMALVVEHAATAVATSPVFNVFGKVGGVWQRLYTIEDTPSADVTVTLSTTDVVADHEVSTSRYISSVASKAVIVDLLGATEIVVGLKTASSTTGGTEATEILYGLIY